MYPNRVDKITDCKPNDLLLFVNPESDVVSFEPRLLYDINDHFLERNCFFLSQPNYFCVKMGVLYKQNININELSYLKTEQLCSEFVYNEPLHIVLATYERCENLKRVFSMLQSQTVKNIHLHLIDNNTNPNMHKKINFIVKQYTNQYQITIHRPYKNLHCISRLLLIRGLLIQYMMNYVVIFDDDQLFESDWLEALVRERKPMSTLGWYGKTYSVCDYWKSDITYTDLEKKRRKDVTKFTYFGPGGCMFDARLFLFAELYEYEKYGNDIHKMDDIWMSFVFSKYLNIPFYRSFKPPIECINKKDMSKMTWFKLKDLKPKFMSMLCEKYGWDVVTK